MDIMRVQLRRVVDDSYDIEVGYDLAEHLACDLQSGLAGHASRIAVITDNIVRDRYAQPIAGRLSECGLRTQVFSFEAGEKSKTRETKAAIEDAMLAAGFRRDCCVVAVGGGVVTDLAGFLAGTFARGVPFVNYATTLLAAADASVGGKTAVDTPLATNLIGLFHQPRKVYIDIAAWKSLPARQIASGLAETIKHACLADAAFFDYLDAHMDEILQIAPQACEHIARENCRIKYSVVMRDERETGLREVLNLGHTVGRALETASCYRLLHGEAVSVGLAAQAELSVRMGYMSAAERDAVRALLLRAGLPVTPPAYVDREMLVKKLYTDKKVKDGKLRFVVQKGIGGVVEFSAGVYATPVEEGVIRDILLSM